MPLLKNRRYLVLMSAQAISNLGDWLYILALFVLVGFRWHGSPIVISLMMLCLTGPMVLLGPFTGLLADKWNRTTLMIVSNLVMAVLVGVIPWLPHRWMVFVVLILVGAFESLFNPAESGKLKEIVPDEHMKQAASINSSIVQLTKVIGPGISGFLVASFGSMSAFWLDSLSFILSTVLLLFTGFKAAVIRSQAQAESAASVPSDVSTQVPQKTGRQRFVEGLNHIRRVRMLFWGTLILTIALFFVQLTDAQIVTLIRLIPHSSSSLVGLIMGLSGAGGLVGALVVSVAKWKSTSRIMAIGSVGIGIGLGASALIVRLAVARGVLSPVLMACVIVAALVVGLCAGLIFIPFQAMAQQQTPEHLTGRVFGTIGSLTTAASLLGPAVGGVLVTGIGVVNGYLVTATALLVMGVIVLLMRKWLEGSTADRVKEEPSVSL